MFTQHNFSLNLAVRDYECDLQGIVNNSVYLNYLEHVRHEYLKHVGIDFATLTREGIHLVVIRAELDYKASLTSGDSFCVGLTFLRESPLRFSFLQDIYRLPDNKLILKAKIIGTALNEHGRPFLPLQLEQLFQST
uniref:Uncharacterized protein n=1 Tax=Chlorobium chlorochromatii (strain CaD3) TaxID=340177 RepID=Q3ANR8_CHLCH